MNSSRIFVGQQEWAFTSVNSDKPRITTCGFGPCYVLSFTAKNHAALAHVDDTTIVESINQIFARFQKELIERHEIKVTLMGGWQGNPSSREWGMKILHLLEASGVGQLSTVKLFSKPACDPLIAFNAKKKEELTPYFHAGAQVDASSGKTYIFNESNSEDNTVVYQRSMSLREKGLLNPCIEVPLQEVFE